MEKANVNGFVVYIRSDRAQSRHPDAIERPLATFESYDEARRARAELRRTEARECVIRFEGDVGGGD